VPDQFGGISEGLATPVDFSAGHAGPAGVVPTIGQHTTEVLREIGLAESDVASLMTAGVIS
jgi:crotonobetainyl-CoA:carnitine CoA-transferase CaiB-like acyl-CoA transferase